MTRRFVLMAGFGFDAFVVARSSPALKARVGIAAYYLATLQSLLAYRFPEFRIVTERETLCATSCIVANAAGYGGGLRLTPDADMTDGVFDVLVVEGKPKLEYVRLLFSAWAPGSRALRSARILRVAGARFEGPADVRVQVDGELSGRLPAEIRIAPESFPLVFSR